MKYILKGKEINIPDEELDNLIDKLDLTMEEAIQVWLEDEGYEVNEEVEALTQKAKDNKITATIHGAKADAPKAKREVVRKENPTKEAIIQILAQTLSNQENIIDLKITNIGKIIEFKTNDGKSFKLDLIQRRDKK